MIKKNLHQLVATLGGTALALGLVACGGTSSTAASTTSSGTTSSVTSSTSDGEPVEIEDIGNDQMWSDDVHGAKFYVLAYDGEVYKVDDCYGVDVYGEEIKDGGFYSVVADVTYLNGGIAGYVNYPEVKSVTSIEEVSPFDVDLPSTEEKIYGVTLIGDYADGDILFYEYGNKAVWKDGSWIWSYDGDVELSDGRDALVRSGVTAEQVEAGAEAGVLSCEDYFVLPERQTT